MWNDWAIVYFLFFGVASDSTEATCAFNSCCHPRACVPSSKGPESCEDVACTEIWYLGTVTKCESGSNGGCVGYTPDEGGGLKKVNECSPNRCCHPTGCVRVEDAPFCIDTICTMEYIEGTISECELEGDTCVGITLEGGRVPNAPEQCPIVLDVRSNEEYLNGHGEGE